ncbi:MAG: hypothetical protein R3C10_10835 [Pirellulales bacterium]
MKKLDAAASSNDGLASERMPAGRAAAMGEFVINRRLGRRVAEILNYKRWHNPVDGVAVELAGVDQVDEVLRGFRNQVFEQLQDERVERVERVARVGVILHDVEDQTAVRLADLSHQVVRDVEHRAVVGRDADNRIRDGVAVGIAAVECHMQRREYFYVDVDRILNGRQLRCGQHPPVFQRFTRQTPEDGNGLPLFGTTHWCTTRRTMTSRTTVSGSHVRFFLGEKYRPRVMKSV